MRPTILFLVVLVGSVTVGVGTEPTKTPKAVGATGTVRSFGLPAEDEVSRMKSGNE